MTVKFLVIDLSVLKEGRETQLSLGGTQEGRLVAALSDGAGWAPRPVHYPMRSLMVFYIKDAPECMQSGACVAELSGLSRAVLVLRDEA